MAQPSAPMSVYRGASIVSDTNAVQGRFVQALLEDLEFRIRGDLMMGRERPLDDYVDESADWYPAAIGVYDTIRGEYKLKAPPLTEIGEYLVVRELGKGGMGSVCLARQPRLDRSVAIKSPLRPANRRERDRIAAEKLTLLRLRHTNICSILDFVDTVPGGPHLVMELVDGVSLGALIVDARRRSCTVGFVLREFLETSHSPHTALMQMGSDPRFVASLMSTVAKAVDHAHDEGVLHRDLKPSNIMLSRSGRPVVVDFGLAVDTTQLARETGALVGTRHHIAPELLTSRSKHYTRATDVYALGVTLCELLDLGPTRSDDRWPSAKSLQDDRQFRALPPDFRSVIHRAVAPLPEGRFATALEFAEELQRFAQGKRVSTLPPSGIARVCTIVRRNSWRGVLVAALLAVQTSLASLGKRAEDRDRHARDSLGAALDVATTVSESLVRGLADVPATPELRRSLLESHARLLDRLRLGDPEASLEEAEIASLAMRGEISESHGDILAAARELESAAEIARSFATSQGAGARDVHRAVRLSLRASDLLFRTRQLADSGKRVEVARLLCDRSPVDDPERRELEGAIALRAARFHAASGRDTEAASLVSSAVEALASAESAGRADSTPFGDLLEAIYLRGDLESRGRDEKGGRAQFERIVALTDQRDGRRSLSRSMLFARARGLARLGELGESNRPSSESDESAFKRAWHDCELLLTLDRTDIEAARIAFAVSYRWAQALQGSGRTRDAILVLERCLLFAEKGLAVHQDDEWHALGPGAVFTMLARAYEAEGMLSEAAAAVLRAYRWYLSVAGSAKDVVVAFVNGGAALSEWIRLRLQLDNAPSTQEYIVRQVMTEVQQAPAESAGLPARTVVASWAARAFLAGGKAEAARSLVTIIRSGPKPANAARAREVAQALAPLLVDLGRDSQLSATPEFRAWVAEAIATLLGFEPDFELEGDDLWLGVLQQLGIAADRAGLPDDALHCLERAAARGAKLHATTGRSEGLYWRAIALGSMLELRLADPSKDRAPTMTELKDEIRILIGRPEFADAVIDPGDLERLRSLVQDSK